MAKHKPTITLASLEVAHGRSNNPGYYRACARRLAAKLDVACPAWALVRTRDSHGCFAPTPPPTPAASISVDDAIASIELCRFWRGQAKHFGDRIVRVGGDSGAVTLIDLEYPARTATFPDALEAASAILEERVQWEPYSVAPLPAPARRAVATR